MQPRTSYSPTALSTRLELTLCLIREELKSQKFFNALSKAGIDDIYYQPNLGKAILSLLEMDDGKDETFEFYYSVIGKRSKKIDRDKEVIMKQAMKVYHELMMEKERRRV